MQIHLSVSGARVYLPLSDVADRFSIGNAALNNIHMLLVSEQLIGTAHCLSSEGDTGRMLAIVGGGVWSGWLGTFAQNVLSDLETHSCFMGCCRMPLTYLTTGIRLMRKRTSKHSGWQVTNPAKALDALTRGSQVAGGRRTPSYVEILFKSCLCRHQFSPYLSQSLACMC